MGSEQYNPVPGVFRYFMKKWPVLFIGYSLLDYNLRLLFKTLSWIGDPAMVIRTYSVDLYPDRLIRAVYSTPRGPVQFIAQDVWTFVPALYQRVTGRKMQDDILSAQ